MIRINKPGFRNLLAYFPNRIQGRERILEDPADLMATDTMEFAFLDLRKIFAFIPDTSAFNDSRSRKNTHNRLRSNRFTRAGFTDDTKSFPLMQIKGNTTDSMD